MTANNCWHISTFGKPILVPQRETTPWFPPKRLGGTLFADGFPYVTFVVRIVRPCEIEF